VASVFRLQERVATMMHGGDSLNRVEREVIEPSDLKPDQKAALWLYAWSFMEGREQREEASRYLLNAR
jgi:hypothetical protein